SENQKQRTNDATAAKKVEKPIARVEPAQRWQQSISVWSGLAPNYRQKLIDGRYPVSADKSVYLDPKGHEGDQIDHTECAQEPAARPNIGWPSHVFAPEQSCNR